MKLKCILATAAVASASIAVGSSATSAYAADTFNVYTGYADSLRPSGFFPTPWLGGAGVVSESPASQGGGFDSGAVRILNTGGSSITITNFTVTMNGGSGPTYNFWSPLTIGAGQNGIFTQTFAYNFDSSDNASAGPPGGINGWAPGSNGIGGCSSTAAAQASAGITAFCAGVQPIVSFIENGNHVSFNDTGHILDTGNYDFINGSSDGNESINWNQIGSAANRGGTVPEPSTWAMMLIGFGAMGFAIRAARRTPVLQV